MVTDDSICLWLGITTKLPCHNFKTPEKWTRRTFQKIIKYFPIFYIKVWRISYQYKNKNNCELRQKIILFLLTGLIETSIISSNWKTNIDDVCYFWIRFYITLFWTIIAQYSKLKKHMKYSLSRNNINGEICFYYLFPLQFQQGILLVSLPKGSTKLLSKYPWRQNFQIVQ